MNNQIVSKALLAAAVIVLLGRCDMPTESPSFSFDTSLKSPVLFERTYQLMGSSTSEARALIDTTAGELDTLFRASGSDNTVSISRSVKGFNVGSLDGVVPEITAPPVSFSVSGSSVVGKAPGKTRSVSVSFTEEGSFSLDMEDVSFTSSEDFVSLASGRLMIEEIVNEFDVGFKRLSIVIDDLRTSPYGSDDGLRITFSSSRSDADDYHFAAIEANQTRRDLDVSLEGLRLVPTDGTVSYTIEGETESISGSGIIGSDDEVRGTLGFEELDISTVRARMAPMTVDLTGDTNGDGRIDIENDTEAQVSTIDGLGDLTEWFDSFELAGTSLDLKITTNVLANADLYAAIQGTNAQGKTVYLRGKNHFAVGSQDGLADHFVGKSGPLHASNLIKIPIRSSLRAGKQTFWVTLDGSTSNVDEFLSALPTEIRFVGRARLNPDGAQHVMLSRPVTFDADLDARLPLTVSGDAFVIEDTVEADFSDLQDATDSGESLEFKGGNLEVLYTNGLPIGANLELEVLDGDHRPIGVAFGGDGHPISINSAQVDGGFAGASSEGLIELALTSDQLDVLDRGRYVTHRLTAGAPGDASVSLRADDRLGFSVRGAFEMRISTD